MFALDGEDRVVVVVVEAAVVVGVGSVGLASELLPLVELPA